MFPANLSESGIASTECHKWRYILDRLKRDPSSENNHFSRKILSVEDAGCLTEYLKSIGKKVVLITGCFDVFHAGHLKFFDHASQTGDVLAVATPTDEQIAEFKNPNRPVNKLEDRLRALSALEMVDFVFPQNSWYPQELFKAVKPSIYAVWAGDQYLDYRREQAKTAGIELCILNTNIDLSSTKIMRALGIE